ncbi:MAG: hypothetical protein ACOX60_04785 [Massiliimalia sp.]|jgi:hypothetical protein
MTQKQVLHHFLKQYGSVIFGEDGKTAFGVLAPVRDLSVRFPNVTYAKVGFVPKREYVLIAMPGEEMIVKHARLEMEGKKLQIADAEDYFLDGEAFYRRAYAYELKEVIP